MLTNVAFTVPGEPQGKGRARVGKSLGGHARMFTPAKTAAYESLVAMIAHQAMAGAGPFNGLLAIEIEAIHSIPPSWSKKRQKEALGAFVGRKPDFDNIAKAIGDGGNGVIWVDDKQIVSALVTKRYGERAEVRVRVAAI
jgi:Holliday junction resolvase RusA-like endonuclease